ncbi:MAG TPA: glycosyltransferase family 4 protein [Thermoanaerobaculia bacterium]|nr:glycosyltransferase family 4 protein [Thermoanaerobaculia bacterium]
MDRTEQFTDSLAGALLFDGEIRDRELQKSMRKEVRVQGFDVFLAGFAKALLAHSRLGPVHVTREAATSFLRAAPPWLQEHAGRLSMVSANDPSELASIARLVLLSVGPEMIQLAWLRSRLHRPDWPITAILHSLSPAPRIRYFFTSALLPMLGRHDAFVCPSRAAKKALENLFFSVPEEIRSCSTIPFEMPVIPFGIDFHEHASIGKEEARRTHGIPSSAVVFLCFGRLAMDKCDLLPLMIAFSQLPKDSGAVLLMAGDDTQLRMGSPLLGLARELGCGDRVQILTDVSRTAKLEIFAAADVFVSPTENTQESFSMTLAEAMASGLPVVTSDWGAHGELVEHGETGFLIPTYLPPVAEPWHMLTLYSGIPQENLISMSTAVDVDHLLHSLQLLLASPDLRERMGREAKRRAAETLDWPVVVGQYDALWLELLERAGAVRAKSGPFACSSFQEVFAGYPTRSLQAEDSVEVNQALGGVARRLPGVLGTSPHFDADLFHQVIATLESEGPTRIDRLVELAAAPRPRSATEVGRHIGRLIKYGVLRVSAGPQEIGR